MTTRKETTVTFEVETRTVPALSLSATPRTRTEVRLLCDGLPVSWWAHEDETFGELKSSILAAESTGSLHALATGLLSSEAVFDAPETKAAWEKLAAGRH